MLLTNSKVMWALIIAFFVIIGFLINFFSFRQGIDFGDGSTFYSFGHNLLHGESIYKDFIHFRTPGSYFINAFFLWIAGDTYVTTKFALGFESQVLFPLIFLLALGFFLRFKRPVIGFITGGLIIFLPAFAQLRSAFALLAVVFYIRARTSKKKSHWLVASGISLGLSFTFGQEIAIAAIAAIGISEIVINFDKLRNVHKTILPSLLRIAVGFCVGVAPLLVYVFIKSDIHNFLYYTLYYAFILQPRSMDIPYPILKYENLVYYLCFVVYILAFFVSFVSKKRDWAFTILLGFVILRAVTMLGRSDMGHLIFVLPEVFFVIIYSVTKFKNTIITKNVLLHFAPFVLAFIISIHLAIESSTFFIIFAVIVLLVAMRSRPVTYNFKTEQTVYTLLPYFALVAVLTLFVFFLYPNLKGVYSNMSKEGVSTTSINGVNVDSATLRQYSLIKKEVDTLSPEYIFSYPIQAYYYSLAPKHATRFMTFELQTTIKEQQEAIADLQKNKPAVVIFDPLQAKDLDGSVGLITTYIKQNYRIKKIVNVTRELWVMVPKET